MPLSASATPSLARVVELADLPRVSSEYARASRRVLGWLGAVPQKVRADLRGIGQVTLDVMGLAEGAALDGEGDVVVPLVADGRPLLAAVDSAFALEIVAHVLGAPPPAVLRPVSRAERGILLALLVSVLRSCWPDVRPLREPPAAPLDVALVCSLQTERVSGRVSLLLASVATVARPDTVRHDRLPPVAASVVLARTTLRANELARLGPSDVVVATGVAVALPSGPDAIRASWTAEVTLGDWSANASLSRAGDLRLAGPFRPRSRVSTTGESIDAGVPAGGAGEAARLLASLPVEVVVEVARVVLRADEVAGLLAGSVLRLGGAALERVTLTVAGRPLVRGTLVDVDGELGVRVDERL